MIRAGDKVIRDTATQNQGKVRLGESAPSFRPIRSGERSCGMPPPPTRVRCTSGSPLLFLFALSAPATRSCGMPRVKIRAKSGWEKAPPLFRR